MFVVPGLLLLGTVVLLRHWIVSLTTAALLLIYIFFLSGTVMAWRAARIAGDRAYCVQVNDARDPYDYKPATRISDLSLSTAFNSRNITETPGKRAGHHSILVLSNPTQLMNWSYWSVDFLPEVVNRDFYRLPYELPVPIRCVPTPGFARKLDLR
jgi:hypothetical protein